MRKKQKVYVGLSGGVDSSVSLALLKKTGYEVTGVFIKSWHPEWLPCDWKSDRRDAMRVCAHLDVPFITLDLEKEYKKEVVDYMISEYEKGRTPNPDVMCNKEIKFGAFLKYARKNGADFVATGHYAQNKVRNKLHHLALSRDLEKDQTYFLWTLNQDQLAHSIFPIGHLKKTEVRVLAKKFGLPTALKKDSQGLCFIGKVDMKDFLSHFVKTERGKVLDVNGKTIGSHDGSIFLTLGQRHGFIVKNKKTNSGPLYVISKNSRNNTVTVSDLVPSGREEVGTKKVYLSQVNWGGQVPVSGNEYHVRIRYRQKYEKAVLKKAKRWEVVFKNPLVGVSPGQSLVVYQGDICLGGGIIEAQ